MPDCWRQPKGLPRLYLTRAGGALPHHRWQHVQAVAARAERLSAIPVWLDRFLWQRHGYDIGYASGLRDTGFIQSMAAGFFTGWAQMIASRAWSPITRVLSMRLGFAA